MAYKILNSLVIIGPGTLPMKNAQRPGRKCNYTRVGPQFQLEEPFSRISAVQNTFFYHVPKLWNHKITASQAAAPSKESFKAYFKCGNHKDLSF